LSSPWRIVSPVFPPTPDLPVYACVARPG